ncbi:unnamed protein product [Effrenium voratum]|nr:unnamed protein product [Effrenium voratum]
MLILWDETYSQRLWCNYELAVHAKTSAGAETITIVPPWMPLWTLSWFGITASLCCLFSGGQSLVLDAESHVSLLVSLIRNYFVPPYAFLFASIPYSWFCLKKLKWHKLLLDEMAHFDFVNAKCALEMDRREIEEQVVCLFDEALEPPIRVAFDDLDGSGVPTLETDGADGALLPETIREIRHITSYPSKDEIIHCFNSYVRGPLRDSVLTAMGKEHEIPLKLSMLSSFPLWFTGLVSVFGCDGRSDCMKSATASGYTSVPQYMAANAVWSLLVAPLFMMILPPLMLRTNQCAEAAVSSQTWQMALGSVLGAIVFFLLDVLASLQWALFILAVAKPSPLWLAGAMLGFGLLVWSIWTLLGSKDLAPSRRSLAQHLEDLG